MRAPFRSAHAAGTSWQDALERCLAQLAPLPLPGRLGFVYVGDPLGVALDLILARLRAATGITDWVGLAAEAVCAPDRIHLEQGAITLLVADWPAERRMVFDGLADRPISFAPGGLAIVHGDHRLANPSAAIGALTAARGAAHGAALVGGLACSQVADAQIAGGATEGGLSGVHLAESVPAITALTQGCSPIGPPHEITGVYRNRIHSLDGRSAFVVLRDEIGDLLARDLGRVGGYIHLALPAAGEDGGEHPMRAILEIDPDRGIVAIGDEVPAGTVVRFVRRDGAAAQADLERMLADLRKRAGGRPVRGALYHTSSARGARLFGPGDHELRRIARSFGDIPLAGCVTEAEIFRDRLYTQAAVLTLFL